MAGCHLARSRTMPPTSEELLETIWAYLGARTFGVKKRIVLAHGDILLSDAADYALASLRDLFRDDVDSSRMFDMYKVLLARCRANGVDPAFAELLRLEELDELLEEVRRPARPTDMPKRVEI